jgi:uridine kinase
MKNSILIGVAGGTASGKTKLARNIVKNFSPDQVIIIEMDSYYHTLDDIPKDLRNCYNFDHPDAYDIELMKQQVRTLLSGGEVNIPVYDYINHTRSKETITEKGHKIIVLEGILALYDEEIRDLMDMKIYVQTAADIRFTRRLKRDIKKRGRSMESVIEQYYNTVRPMHEQFVEPTKVHADIIIPEGGKNSVAIDLFTTKVESLLKQLKQDDEIK